ncbi:MAG: hypothetical protein MZV64_30030 [Ignavibacteriales bacterium]|nr:hypothetical protein [Ignavibacteriales bacterium]
MPGGGTGVMTDSGSNYEEDLTPRYAERSLGRRAAGLRPVAAPCREFPPLPQNLMTAPIDAVPWAIVAEPS